MLLNESQIAPEIAKAVQGALMTGKRSPLGTADGLQDKRVIPQCLQVHALVQTVGKWLTDELVGDLVLVETPFVLDRELSQLLCSSQCALKLVDSAAEVVLALLEHRLRLENSEDWRNRE